MQLTIKPKGNVRCAAHSFIPLSKTLPPTFAKFDFMVWLMLVFSRFCISISFF